MKNKKRLKILVGILTVLSIVFLTITLFYRNQERLTKPIISVEQIVLKKTLEEKKEEIKDFFTEEELNNITDIKDILINGEVQKVVEKQINNPKDKISNRELISINGDGEKINLGEFG